jgi:hypothetical protein
MTAARAVATQQGKSIDSIPGEVMAALTSHDWPGNTGDRQTGEHASGDADESLLDDYLESCRDL